MLENLVYSQALADRWGKGGGGAAGAFVPAWYYTRINEKLFRMKLYKEKLVKTTCNRCSDTKNTLVPKAHW